MAKPDLSKFPRLLAADNPPPPTHSPPIMATRIPIDDDERLVRPLKKHKRIYSENDHDSLSRNNLPFANNDPDAEISDYLSFLRSMHTKPQRSAPALSSDNELHPAVPKKVRKLDSIKEPERDDAPAEDARPNANGSKPSRQQLELRANDAKRLPENGSALKPKENRSPNIKPKSGKLVTSIPASPTDATMSIDPPVDQPVTNGKHAEPAKKLDRLDSLLPSSSKVAGPPAPEALSRDKRKLLPQDNPPAKHVDELERTRPVSEPAVVDERADTDADADTEAAASKPASNLPPNDPENSRADSMPPKDKSVELAAEPATGDNESLESARPALSRSSSAAPAKDKSRSIKHSEAIVRASIDKYKNHFHVTANADDSDSTTSSHNSTTPKDALRVELEYPRIGITENFLLLKPVKSNTKHKSSSPDDQDEDKDEYNPITDLIRTANMIADHYLPPDEATRLFGDDQRGVLRELAKHRNRHNGAAFVAAVNEFNEVLRKVKEDGQIAKHARRMGAPSFELVCHILYQVYSRTVAPHADSLNQYQAFSNTVYGEVNAILTKEFIERTGINSRSVFVDMGCGIGNVVLQVAAMTGCEAHGIEIMDTPCKFAKLQLKEYAARMRYERYLVNIELTTKACSV
ncbi:S-adenosyl-L-methionine-dependent methyltransferase [Endogone sp. FLAS-F59071]|nr:S-adenosyl-L-methionine-dependent methyltransferase [Endogone sp. FLAS-F59071]|eukprot:RUS18448.1 S-adenosyl-L-methionine-dependent methyltransferase [Endogone sp. FLAS-F59071]